MTVPKMEVRCGVDSCQYWNENYCTANGVEVNPMDDSYAETSDDTCCTTFRPTE